MTSEKITAAEYDKIIKKLNQIDGFLSVLSIRLGGTFGKKEAASCRKVSKALDELYLVLDHAIITHPFTHLNQSPH